MMQTQCPSCASVFRVTHQQLSAASGRVRCGQCNFVFNGTENIKRARHTSAADSYGDCDIASRAADYSSAANSASVGVARESSLPWHTQPKCSAPAPASGRKIAQPEQQPLPPLPIYLDEPAARLRRGHRIILYSVSLLALGLILAAGYAYDDSARDSLTDSPALASVMAKACGYLDCEIESRRDIDRFKIIDRNIYSRPDRSGTLFITATVVNNASFAQAYPLMQVSFTNLQGTVVAKRRFHPYEYVSPAPAADALMPPRKPIEVRATMADPGVDAVAFEFAFL